MERFTQFEDKSNGINPFVPLKTRNKLFYLIELLKLPFTLLKVTLLLSSLSLLLTSDTLASKAPSRIAYILKLLVCVPLARFSLLLISCVYISENEADGRKLGLGMINNAQRTSIKAGDIVLSNSISIEQILFFYYRFLPKFKTSLSSNDELTLFQMVLRATSNQRNDNDEIKKRRKSRETGSKMTQNSSFARERVIVFFPEEVRTNGRGILSFSSETNKYLSKTKQNIHLFCLNRNEYYDSDSHFNNRLIVLFKKCSRRYTPLDYEIIYSDNLPQQKDSSTLRELMAKISGKRVKTVKLNKNDYFNFVKYYSN